MHDPLGVIDIGSNSGRVTVLRLEESGHLAVIGDARRSLRLVRDLSDRRSRLREKTMLRTVEAVRGFQMVALGAGAARCLAVATSAVREATNGGELVDRIRDETGLEVDVVDGSREAALAFLGGIHGLPVEHGLLADMGGGSLQLARFRERALVGSWSLPLGALRLSDQFLRSDPPRLSELGQLRRHVRQALSVAGVPPLADDELLVGTGGTIRNLAKIDRALRSYPLPRLHGFTLTRRRVDDVASLLAHQALAHRPRIPGLNPDRSDSITGGAVAFGALMSELGARDMLVSGHGLREGLALDALAESLPSPIEVRQASIAGLGARFATWQPQVAARRARLALLLLDAFDPGADARQRELLVHAASVLDVGQSLDFYNRHTHAAQFVLEADLSGFSHRDVAMLAAIVRSAEGDGAVDGIEQLTDANDLARVARVSAVVCAADQLDRLLNRDPRLERRGHTVTLFSNLAESWILNAPLRRLSQAFGVAVRLLPLARAA